MFTRKMFTRITVLFTAVIVLASCNKDDDHNDHGQHGNEKLWKIKSNENDSTIFTYTTNGRLHKVATTEVEDESDPVVYTFTYAAGSKVSEITSSTGLTYKFRYDGNVLTFSEAFRGERKLAEIRYQYENNKLVSTTLFNPYHGDVEVITLKPSFKTAYSYDDKGGLAKVTSYLANPNTSAFTKIAEKHINQYDDAKNPLTVLNALYLATFFEFQGVNNVVKETVFGEQGEIEETTVNSHVYNSRKYPVSTTSVITPVSGAPATRFIKYYYQ